MVLALEATTNPTHTVWLSAAVLLTVALTYSIRLSWRHKPRCNAIDITPSLLERIRWIGGMAGFIQHAYTATGRSAFQYTTLLGQQQLVVCSDKLIAELGQAPADTINFRAWSKEVAQIQRMLPLYATGRTTLYGTSFSSRVSMPFFKTTMNRDLAETFPQIHADLTAALTPELLHGGFTANELSRKAFAKVSVRYLVGEPLCQDAEFCDALNDLADQMGITIQVLHMSPAVLKPFALRCMTKFHRRKAYIFDKLHALAASHPATTDKHNLFSVGLTALARYNGKDSSWTLDRLATEMCHSAFASNHTTSGAFCKLLIELAARPEYQPLLRDEVRQVVFGEGASEDDKEAKGGGWSRASIDRLHKMDSFMCEMRRLRPMSETAINRKALKDYTFSDGTSVSRGMYVSAAFSPRNLDDTIYPGAAEFDGLRFYKLRMAHGMDDGDRDTFIDVDRQRNLEFGAGRTACPGRVWATAVIKCALAHLLLHYRILPATPGKPLQHTFGFGGGRIASRTDRIVFQPL